MFDEELYMVNFEIFIYWSQLIEKALTPPQPILHYKCLDHEYASSYDNIGS